MRRVHLCIFLSLFSWFSQNLESMAAQQLPALCDRVISCFAERLGLHDASQDAVLDSIIDRCGLEKNNMTRTMLLGTIVAIAQSDESQKNTCSQQEVELIADDIARAIDSMFSHKTKGNAKAHGASYKKWIIVGAVAAAIVAAGFLWAYVKEQQGSILAYQEKVTKLNEEKGCCEKKIQELEKQHKALCFAVPLMSRRLWGNQVFFQSAYCPVNSAGAKTLSFLPKECKNLVKYYVVKK